MVKNRRHQLIITDAEKALLEMEERLTLIEDMSTAKPRAFASSASKPFQKSLSTYSVRTPAKP